MRRVPPAVIASTLAALVLALPLAGALLAGRPLREFTRFPPPLEVHADYLRFSWWAVAAVAALLALVGGSWLRALRANRINRKERRERKDQARSSDPARSGDRADSESLRSLRSLRLTFPGWGWAALAWTGTWWVLAWTRLAWFAPLQAYTFFPLWLGFIVTVHAVVERRTGSCLMRRAPARWLALFGASAACWWSFEWLNRFVRNWHYLHAEQFGPFAYFVHATICFSTVLPAVAAVAEWLDSHCWWRERAAAGPAWTWLARRDVAALLAALGGGALFATGWWPTWFYPALWLSPLAVALATSVLLGRRGLAHEMAAGDWRRAAPWIVAALVCGFFWEMWNAPSLTKWIYTVPGVERWHLFEMPAFGYAGYLPFGLECLLVAEGVIGARWRSGGQFSSPFSLTAGAGPRHN